MNRVAHSIVIGASLAFLAGCAGQPPRLTLEERRTLSESAQIHVAQHRLSRGFLVESTAYTAIGVLLTPMVAGAMVQEGNTLQKELQLEDPATHLKARLFRALQSELKLSNARLVADPLASDEADELRQALSTGIVLEVRTTHWGIDNNRAKYGARARLVRLSDSAVLWQGKCEAVPDKGHRSPEREALVANSGDLLKTKLRQAADACAEQLIAAIVGR